jgi:hypothetical protein
MRVVFGINLQPVLRMDREALITATFLAMPNPKTVRARMDVFKPY